MNTPKLPSQMAPDSHRRKKREATMPQANGLPESPLWLNAAQCKIFDSLCRELAPLRVAKRIDSEAIALMACALHEYRELNKDIKKHGYMMGGRDGGYVANPLLGKRDNAWSRYASMLKEFGATPVSRARIATGIENEESELSKFLNGIRQEPTNTNSKV